MRDSEVPWDRDKERRSRRGTRSLAAAEPLPHEKAPPPQPRRARFFIYFYFLEMMVLRSVCVLDCQHFRPSHPVIWPSHPVIWPSHSVTWPSHSVTWPSHSVPWPSHSVTWPTEKASREGFPRRIPEKAPREGFPRSNISSSSHISSTSHQHQPQQPQ
jgi:hypothetical protein